MLCAATIVAAGLALALAGARAATIQTDLQIYYAGDTVHVTGAGFAPDETVSFTTTDPIGTLVDMGTAPANDAGDVSYSFVLGEGMPGDYLVSAIGLTSGEQATTTFDPPANPTALHFTDSRDAGGSVVLSYTGPGSPGAQCYYVYRSTSGPPAPTTHTVSCTTAPSNVYGMSATTTFTDPSATPGTRYWYGVTAVRDSGTQTGESTISNIVDTATETVSPTSFNFGTVTGGSSTQHAFTFTNNGSASVTFQGISMTGPQATDYGVTTAEANNVSIPVGGTFTFTVTFAPPTTASGTRTAAVQILTHEALQPAGTNDAHQVGVTGTVNSAPSCSSQSTSTNEDTAKAVTLSCSDPNAGDTFTVSVTGVFNGTVTGSYPNYTFTPNANFNGTGSFTYVPVDNHGLAGSASTATITVNPVNDGPTAVDGTASINEDGGSVLVDLRNFVTDVETTAGAMTYTVSALSPASAGTLTAGGTPGTYTFAPAADFNGIATFTYTAKDTGDPAGCTGGLPACSPAITSASKTVTITVNPVNDAPTANGTSITMSEDDAALPIDLKTLVFDKETAANQMTYTLVSGPSSGTVTIGAAGVFSYKPNANYNGPDAFTFRVTDTGDGSSPPLSAQATVSLTIDPINDTPTAADTTVLFTEDDPAQSLSLRPLVSDVETATANLTYTIVSGPTKGSLVADATPGNYQYKPNANANGTDTFTYSVTDRGDPDNCFPPSASCDGVRTSATHTVTVNIAPVNDGPTMSAIPDVSFGEGGSTIVDLASHFNDVETPGAAATYTIVSAPPGLTTTVGPGGQLQLSAADNLTGDVTVRGTDTGDGVSPPLSAQTTFHVGVLNLPPTAVAQQQSRPATFERLLLSSQVLTSNAPFTVTVPDSVPAGHTLLVSVAVTQAEDDGLMSNVTDSAGNGYQLLGGFAPGDGRHGFTESMATTYVTHPLAAGDTIGITINPTYFSWRSVQVWELSGIMPHGVDRSWFGFGFFTNPITTAVTEGTQQADELLFGSFVIQHWDVMTPGTGYTLAGQTDFADSNKTMYGETMVVHDFGEYSATAGVGTLDTNVNAILTLRQENMIVTLTTPTDPSSVDASSLHYAFSCSGDSLAGTTYATAGTSPSISCPPFDGPGTYQVTARIFDKDGGFSDYVQPIVVENAPPSGKFTATTPVNEGSPSALSITGVSDSKNDMTAGFTYAFDCGSGTLSAFSSSPTASCTPDDNGTVTMRGAIRDAEGGTKIYSQNVVVRNVPPTATLSAPPSAFMGDHWTLAATNVHDVSSADEAAGFMYAYDCGDGYTQFFTTSSFSCPTFETGTLTIGIQVRDKDLGFVQVNSTIVIQSKAPTATLNAPDSVAEGSSIHVSLDNGQTTSGTPLAYAFDCGSGYGAFSSSNATDCPTIDNGPVTVKGTVRDGNGLSTEYTKSVSVTNVAPSVAAASDQSASEGSPVLLQLGSFTDPGASDAPWHVVVDWGDGSSSAFDTPTQGDLGSLTHIYGDNGSYSVSVAVTDKDGGSGSAGYSVAVANVAPTGTFGATSPVDEGSPTELSFTDVSDPSSADSPTLTASYSCDGTTYTSSSSCSFDDDGSYVVYGRLADKDGGTTDYSTTVTVDNVAPTATFSATSPIDEGSSATLSFSDQADPSAADTAAGFTYAYACDGVHFGAAVAGSASSCSFDTPGTYTVRAQIADKDGGTTTYSDSVLVQNNAPSVTAAPAQSASEGTSAQLALGSFGDPGPNDGPWHVGIAWGDGTSSSFDAATRGGLGNLAHTYADNGTDTVTVTVTDALGASGSATFAVTVANVAPTATVSNDGPVGEGSPAHISFTNLSDPSSVDAASLTTQVACNGSTFTSATSCTFDDQGSYVVGARVSDKDGGHTDYTTTVVVTNVAPTATLNATSPIDEGSATTISFSNIFDPSHADTSAGFTLAYSCNGTTFTSTNTCSFNDNGSYVVYGRVTDKDGGSTIVTANVTVRNVAPTATLSATSPINEGSATTISFSNIFDPSTADTIAGFTKTYSCDGTTYTTTNTCTLDDNGTFTVYGKIADKDGGTTTLSTSVTVSNVAPTATFAMTSPINEGSSSTPSFSNIVDPSHADTAAGFTYEVACDGTNFAPAAPCPFNDNGTYTVKGRITDKNGGSSTYTTTVAVNNVAPTGTFAATSPISEGGTSTLSFTNVFDPSTADSPTLAQTFSCDGTNFGTSSTCTFPTAGTYTVKGRITDKDGGATTYSAQVVVQGVAPVVTAPANQSANEGASPTFALGSFSDPGTGPWTVNVTWGDGQSSSFQASAPGSLSRSHTYDDNGTYTVNVSVTDPNTNTGSASFTVTVANVAPTATFSATTPVNEGSATTLSLTNAHDPSTADTTGLTATYSCNGSTFTSTASCTFANDGTYTVYGRITDKDNGSTTYSQQVVVDNVVPTLTPGAAQSGTEGADTTWSLGSFSDPGANDNPWTVNVNWGDGTSSSFTTATRGAISYHHPYADQGMYTVSTTVTDKDGGVSLAQSFVISISNVTPVVTAPLDQVGTEGTSAPFSLGSFSDPGSDSPWSVSVNWGDGSAATTFQTSSTGALVPAGHTFADNGLYTVTVTVKDKDNAAGSATFKVSVSNAAPVVTTGAGPTAAEGTSTLFSLGSFSDLGAGDSPWAVDVNWGDGSTHATFSTSTQGSIGNQTHAFPDNGSYTVTVKVTDKDGASGTSSYTVTVTNVPPTAAFAQIGTASEGGSATVAFSGQFDPSSADTTAGFQYAYDCGTGYGAWTTSASTTCPFANSGTYTVHGKIKDKDGGTNAYDATVTVQNVAPTATIANNGPINEGGSAHITLSGATDVSPADVTAGFTYAFACDGSTFPAASTTASADCPFADSGSYTVKGRVFDKDGGYSTYSTTVVVNNVAPTATLSNNGPVAEGSPVTVSFAGQFDPSSVDTSAGFTYQYACDGTTNYGAATTSASATCTFTDNGTPTVRARILDKDGGSTSYTTAVTVTNVAPTLTAAANQTASEGTSTTFALGSLGDPGTADNPWTVNVNWGDGSTSSFNSATLGAISSDHTYADNGSYTVSTTVTDKDGGSSAAQTFTVTVANVSPALTAAATQSSNEGSSLAVDLGSFADPGANDAPWTVDVNWGDGTTHTTFSTATRGALGTKPHTYDDGTHAYTVTVTVTDKDGGTGSASFTVNVANVAPTATFNAPSSVAEGSSIALSLSSPSDPSSGDTAAGFTYAFDCGSGYGAFGSSNTTSCATTDNGTRAVKGKIQDRDGGVTEYTATVPVTNVAPTATLNAPDSVSEGSAINVSLSAPSDPSSADTAAGFTYAFDCGTGYAAATTTNSTSCPTTDNGTVTVKAMIIDKDGGATEYTKAVTVNNVAPTGNWPTTASGTAGSPVTISWNATADASSADMTAGLHFAYDCNGGAITATYATAGTSMSVTCTFASAGTYTVNARVIDKDGGFTDYSTTVTVAANPPVTAFTSGSTSIPGGTASGTQFTYSGSITNGDATTTVAADCGTIAIVSGSLTYTTDGSGNRNGFSFKCVFVYTSPTTYTLHATASRGSVAGPTATLSVAITAAPPVVTITSPATTWIGSRGSTLTVVSSFTDPLGAAGGPYKCTINWGDGSANTVLTINSPGSCTSSHMYVGAATLLTVTVTDKNGVSGSATRAVRVP